DKWGKKYPMVVRSWENNWLELTTYFGYPRDIRRLIYTTNTAEGHHRQLQKVTKTKTAYLSDDALRNIIYLATMDITKKWTMPVREWANCMSQFVIQFGDRMEVNGVMA
ncbi:MAG: transposase, partial [Ignavibacteriales bacterium]